MTTFFWSLTIWSLFILNTAIPFFLTSIFFSPVYEYICIKSHIRVGDTVHTSIRAQMTTPDNLLLPRREAVMKYHRYPSGHVLLELF